MIEEDSREEEEEIVKSEKVEEEVVIMRSDDDGRILLNVKIHIEDVYELQEDHLIVWTELNEEGVRVRDIAVSFLEEESCALIWEEIERVRGEKRERASSPPSSSPSPPPPNALSREGSLFKPPSSSPLSSSPNSFLPSIPSLSSISSLNQLLGTLDDHPLKSSYFASLFLAEVF